MSIPEDMIRKLTERQADGLACVVCNTDYIQVAVPHRPVGRSETGSQVFACRTCIAWSSVTEEGR